jgi:hypothetical protein
VTAPNVDQDAATAAAQLDPDAQLDLLDHELARRRAERKAEADRAKAAGGPCSRCGATESWKRLGVGGDQDGAICHPCDQLRGGPADDDREARIRAARLVLGQTAALRGRAMAATRPSAGGMTATWPTRWSGGSRSRLRRRGGRASGSGT